MLKFAAKNFQMETDRVGILLFKMSVPAVSVSVINIIVGFLSGAIIAGMNIDYLTAYTIALPVSSSMPFVFMNGVRSATASLVARRFGDKERINTVIFNGFLFTTVMLLLYTIFCIIAVRPFVRLYSQNEFIIKSSIYFIYLSLIPNCISAFSAYFSQLLQGLGKIVETSMFSLFSIPATIVLNIIFIYGRLGAPRMGLYGIPCTSAIVTSLGLLYHIYLLKNAGYADFLKKSLSMECLREMANMAVPISLQQGLATILVSGYNMIVRILSEQYITVMGIFYNWNSINQNLMLCSSLLPVVGYNTSKNHPERVRKTVRQSLAYTFIVGAAFTAFYLIFTEQCLNVFNCPKALISDAAYIFRILSLYVLPMSMVTVINNLSVALGNGRVGMSALVVQTALTLGGGLILKNFGGFYAIYAFPFAEIITFVFVAVLIFKGKANSEKIIKSALPIGNAA